MYTPKEYGKSEHKHVINHKNRGPPPRFSHNPKYPPSKEFENDCASMLSTYGICVIVPDKALVQKFNSLFNKVPFANIHP
jgi:hypothetical protein